MSKERLLIVDDEPAQREMLAGYLTKKGYQITQAGSGGEALKIYPSLFAPLALVDMKMPGMSGIDLIKELKRLNPYIQVIVLTAFGSVETAVKAMRAGAFDYLTKPVEELEELLLRLEKAKDQYRLVSDHAAMKERLADIFPTTDLIGDSPPMLKLKKMISMVAPKDSTVLITGPSGTGKELVARAVHALSPRANEKLVALNCAALPETLLESELFGYVKGAFTGADRDKPGRFEMANGGTLFLDEIGEMPLSMQVKLLRVIEERTVGRLGATSETSLDIRLIAATNRDVNSMVAEKTLREDLYYRLNVIRLDLPPLCQRGGDILKLAEHFITKYAKRVGKIINGIDSEAAALLTSYSWPGNVRELENMIERAIVLSETDHISVSDLTGLASQSISEEISDQSDDRSQSHVSTLAEVESEYIQNVLKSVSWSITNASDILGIHRNTLRSKIKEYNLSK